MADNAHAGEHHGPSFQAYMIVAGALAVCTISSFFFNSMARAGSITPVQSFVAIMGVAMLKAVLVVMIFMHLKYDWKLLYFLLIPVFIMAVMMMIVLLPDTLLGPNRDAKEALKIGEAQMPEKSPFQ